MIADPRLLSPAVIPSEILPPSRFLLCTWGSSGDLHPFLSLGCALKQRGHTVAIAGIPLWESKVRQAGLDFIAAANHQDMDSLHGNEKLFSTKYFGITSLRTMMRDYIVPTFAFMTDALLEAAPHFDCLVSHSFILVAPIVAAKTGIRYVSASLSPGVIPSAYSMPAGSIHPPFRGLLGPHINRSIWDLGMWMIRPHVDPSINAFRKKYGLPSQKNAMFYSVSNDLHLQLYSRHFAPPEPDWPGHFHQSGFCYWDETSEWTPPADLLSFLKKGAKPILFTLGTSAIFHPLEFYRNAIEAVKKTGHRAILLTGHDANTPQDLPPQIFPLHYAPYAWLMPHCQAVAHQCGIGTIAQALRAGIPSILCPYAFDQPNNAVRAMMLGAGVLLKINQRDPENLATAIRRVTNDSHCQEAVQSISHSIQTEDGPVLAAARLESFLQKRT